MKNWLKISILILISTFVFAGAVSASSVTTSQLTTKNDNGKISSEHQQLTAAETVSRELNSNTT